MGTTLLLALLQWRGMDVPVPVWAAWVGTWASLTAVAALPQMWSECRVEGDHLWFRSRGSPPISVPVDDVVAIDRVEHPDDPAHYELVVRGRGRMVVPADVFEPVDALRRVVRDVNPGVRFGTRSGVYCHSCGGLVRPQTMNDGLSDLLRRDHAACGSCNEPLPRNGEFV